MGTPTSSHPWTSSWCMSRLHCSLETGRGRLAIGSRRRLDAGCFRKTPGRPQVWDDCDITVEFGEPADGRQSVGAWTAQRLARDMPVVIQDHLAGELADFIAIAPNTNPVQVCLAHCKRSGGDPAARVTDIEELVAQGVRSVRWLRPGPALWSELQYRLEHRNATRLVSGERAVLDGVLDQWIATPPLVVWSLWLVQPGVSIARLDSADGV